MPHGTSSTPKGILCISYHFPPSAAVGGARMVNFAKWLAASGWDTHALTIADRYVERLDRSRLEGIEGIRIHKTGVLPTADGVLSTVQRRWARQRPADKESAAPGRPSGRADGRGRETLSRRLRRYILSFLLLPDRERGWILPAVAAAVRCVRRHHIGWIITSCPPYSSHLIGLAVTRLTRSAWVADFRDPWMTTGSKRLYPTCAASSRIESWLERKVVERADLVLFNVERLRNAYRDRYRHVPSDKFVFIPNAVVPRAAAPGKPVSKYDTFTLSYTGSFYLGRSPEPVCAAVARLIGDGRVRPEQVRIKLVGQCREIDGLPTSALVRKYGLESVVEVGDPVPYAEAQELISRSHLALLLAPNLPFQIPAKAYDYLGAGTPILAIAEEGGTADLVRDTGAGRAFPPDDVEGIMEFISQEMQASRSGSGAPAPGPSLPRYDARRLTEELVSHLRRVEAVAETRRHR